MAAGDSSGPVLAAAKIQKLEKKSASIQGRPREVELAEGTAVAEYT